MIYKCQKIPIVRLRVLPTGFQRPLCNTCKSKDCENPIEVRTVPVAGVNEKMRLFCTRNNASMVVGCEGYLP